MGKYSKDSTSNPQTCDECGRHIAQCSTIYKVIDGFFGSIKYYCCEGCAKRAGHEKGGFFSF
jgi:hypothetical protein